MLEKVIEDLQVKENELEEFDVEDSFNDNKLRGFICSRSDHRYGTLVITHINNKEAYQIIYATPKLHYPMDKLGNFHFPKAQDVEIYEKLDGTNVTAYRYVLDGKIFQTYKSRLTPVLRGSKYGDFLSMWKELTEKYPQINNICEANDCNISFEMYGSRNPHLILYDVPLETSLLFGISKEGRILSPSKLDNLNLPTAKLFSRVTSEKELKEEYNRFRQEIESNNTKTEDDLIRGLEGVVWYLNSIDGKTIQFKCKPESVEQIHWASDAIDINTIKATAHNVLETEEKITYEATVKLLKEEFDDDKIAKSGERIRKIVFELQKWYEFQKGVLEIYDRLGISINDDKGRVMREMSKKFPRNDMKKVYNAIVYSGN